MKKKILAWIEATRLRTLPVSVAGVVCAMGCAKEYGYDIGWVGVICLLFAVLCQIASNFANEYFDYRSGRDAPGREGPRRGVTEGDISPKSMLYATFFVIFVASLCGLSLLIRGGWFMIIVGVLVIAGIFAYSSGPVPLSTHSLGEVAVVIFFGLIPVCITYYLITFEINAPVLAASFAVGLMGANVLIVNNYRDIPDDRSVGKKTLAVRFGRRAMMMLYILNNLISGILIFPIFYKTIGVWAIVISLIIVGWGFMATSQMKKIDGRALNPWLGKTALVMFAVFFIFFLLAWINF